MVVIGVAAHGTEVDVRERRGAFLGRDIDGHSKLAVVDHQEPVPTRELVGDRLAQRVLGVRVEARLQHQLQQLLLVILRVVGEEDVAVDVLVPLVQLVEPYWSIISKTHRDRV